ncbi:MAG TPA: hypothetical protein VL992_09780 [Tepidisphaeraceae bacterium]|nr:hypothetical protein [Tepidisphaeraceae bacterium]
MSVKSEFDVAEILDSAASAFSDAMKAGVKAQEEVVKWWTGALDGGCQVGDFQKRGRQFLDEAVPAAQKQAQDWMKVLDSNSRRSVDLLRKALNAENDGVAAGLTDAARKLWEDSISVIKENFEALTQANVKMLEVWSDLIRKSLDQQDAAVKAAAAKPKQN